MAVTSKQIAEICGISRGTVDRALNNRPGVNPKTKELILRTAEQMGYRPHFIASSLARGKTMTIGLVVFDLYNRIFSQLINSIEYKAKEEGYFVYLTLTDKDRQTEKQCIDHLVDRRVDGIIILPVNKGTDYEEYLEKKNIPIVTFGNKISDKYPYIWIDNRQAVKDSFSYLAGRGYKTILYVCPLGINPDINAYAIDQRILAFHESADIFSSINTKLVDSKKFKTQLDELLHDSNNKPAILCSSDIFALDVLEYLTQKGLKVPQDVGLMGFDNIDTLKYIKPALATIGYPVDEIGTAIVTSLIEKINGNESHESLLFNHTIITGNSI